MTAPACVREGSQGQEVGDLSCPMHLGPLLSAPSWLLQNECHQQSLKSLPIIHWNTFNIITSFMLFENQEKGCHETLWPIKGKFTYIFYCIAFDHLLTSNAILISYFQFFIQKNTQLSTHHQFYHKHIRTDFYWILSLHNGEPAVQIKMTDSPGWQMRERGRSCEKLHKWLRGPACPLSSLGLSRCHGQILCTPHCFPLRISSGSRSSGLRRAEKLRCWHCCRIRVSWTRKFRGEAIHTYYVCSCHRF